jgi:molybdate transport system substrate-binding protein
LALTAVAGACRSPAAEPAVVRVAAAADLSDAFAEVGLAFEKATGQKVLFTFGSSGLLATHLSQGAPFDVFAAASRHYAEQTVIASSCDRHSMAGYARGRLAIWSNGKETWTPKTLAELADPRVARIAIANPDHAPYGLAAKQALERAGVWQAVSAKLVLAENVRQTLQFAATGNANVALVALSLVIQDRRHPWTLIDDALHQPLQQTLVVCKGGKNPVAGQDFAQFLLSSPGRAILERYGFAQPDH